MSQRHGKESCNLPISSTSLVQEQKKGTAFCRDNLHVHTKYLFLIALLARKSRSGAITETCFLDELLFKETHMRGLQLTFPLRMDSSSF